MTTIYWLFIFIVIIIIFFDSYTSVVLLIYVYIDLKFSFFIKSLLMTSDRPNFLTEVSNKEESSAEPWLNRTFGHSLTIFTKNLDFQKKKLFLQIFALTGSKD